jgi:replicative DNA helicase
MNTGKIQPQATELEEKILGSLLIEPSKIYEVGAILKPKVFYKPTNQKIYSVIEQMFRSHEQIDILTVCEKLKAAGKLEAVGGEVYITELTDRIGTTSHIVEHSRIVYQKYLQREMIKLAYEIENKAYDDSSDVAETLAFCEKSVMDLSSATNVKDCEQIGVICNRELERISEVQSEIANGQKSRIGVTTGFSKIKFYKSDLIILAARPAMGKTYLTLQMLFNAAMYDLSVGFFSLEMSASQVASRTIALHSGVSSNRFRDCSLCEQDWVNLEGSQHYFNNLKFYIDDQSGLSVYQIISKMRKMKMQLNIELFAIDYLQLIKLTRNGDKRTDNSLIGEITWALKCAAKELDVPIVLLSQLNRDVEKRQDKRPKLSDLRDSGNIEQDADEVYMIYRPYEYSKSEHDFGTIEINKSKSRHSSMFTQTVYHNADWTKIQEDEISDNPVPELPTPKNITQDDIDTPF